MGAFASLFGLWLPCLDWGGEGAGRVVVGIGIRLALILVLGLCGVCGVESWLRRPQRARVRLIGLRGWEWVHTCVAFGNQSTQA